MNLTNINPWSVLPILLLTASLPYAVGYRRGWAGRDRWQAEQDKTRQAINDYLVASARKAEEP